MLWDKLVETVLAGPKRKRELKIETKSAYKSWVKGVDTELVAFVKRADKLDLTEAGDRSKMYELVDTRTSRLEQLRNDRDAHQAPHHVLNELDELIEFFDGLPPSGGSVVTYLGNDPWKKAKLQQKREQREQANIERVTEERDEIANRILSFRNTVEDAE